MARQGCHLHEREIRRILQLLETTDLSLPEIADRTSCTRGAIATINRRFLVRDYQGHRSSWSVRSAPYRTATARTINAEEPEDMAS